MAWQYFQNAFSVQTDLLYHKSNFTAIQVCPCSISISSPTRPPPPINPKLRFEADEREAGLVHTLISPAQ